ncbi:MULTISPECIES: GNAT family N-acetyltransferase [Brevibacterium]|uniref:N-acetyltransferase n=1 Tax=Brevibacterium aurantiacum TaxID=273384 RepID=A0A1D7W773_BREAU|nr:MULTISPECIES: GNAT family protein [Brevibacterium]MDN5549667.1 GNAT family N-acetyltransferase [Brevibacterium sp.]AOP54903.1 Ribosomal-protein-S5p-alanine acetyltransferase [Brevibacterium aurantiacum]AZL06841.1 N-acetyltransferase [Brevibacterium aurantiacum]AZL10384.1 N-acetyltransferase [Brevibacterium aurantiacum]AZT94605.1 N-acetyltransferase [Brevibacterium aurantiacum]
MWPVILTDQQSDIVLRPLHRRDENQWREVRRHNRDWLRPWDATLPIPGQQLPGFRTMVRMYDKQAKRGQSVPLAIEVGGAFRGQLTVSSISWGSILSGQIGYWIDSRVAGRGITPIAVAMAVDHCLFALGLHRIEINIRPENTASLRIVEKLGFRDEGLREKYMHIDGRWCDHRTFALVAEEVPQGILAAYRHSLRKS